MATARRRVGYDAGKNTRRVLSMSESNSPTFSANSHDPTYHKLYRSLIYWLFTLSGLVALIYEGIWARYLKLFLGHSSYGQILTLCIFMGGMGIGALLAARYTKSIKNNYFLPFEFMLKLVQKWTYKKCCWPLCVVDHCIFKTAFQNLKLNTQKFGRELPRFSPVVQDVLSSLGIWMI